MGGHAVGRDDAVRLVVQLGALDLDVVQVGEEERHDSHLGEAVQLVQGGGAHTQHGARAAARLLGGGRLSVKFHVGEDNAGDDWRLPSLWLLLVPWWSSAWRSLGLGC